MSTTLSLQSRDQSSTPQLNLYPSLRDKCDIITTVAASVLLIIFFSLSIHYVRFPIPPMIQITANFSLSLPIIICSSLGCVTTITLIVQIIRRAHIKEAFEKCVAQKICSSDRLQHLIRYALHPGGRAEGESIADYLPERIDWLERARVNFQTRDGLSLGGYWYKNHNPEAPTAIIFHGNGERAENLVGSWGEKYKELGFNVLLAEYRGYGISEGEAAKSDQEIGAYLDAEAALKFVLGQGVKKDKILAHGYSLGGVYAAALGYFFDIKHVVLNHTFTDAAAVACNTVSLLSHSLAERAIQASYTQMSIEQDRTIPDAKPLATDLFNNLAKIEKMAGEILVIRGKKDKLMNMSFGEAFVQAKYPQNVDQRKANLITIDGGHTEDFYNFYLDSEAQRKFNDFILRRGLISEIPPSERA
jgi:esterase/lipase